MPKRKIAMSLKCRKQRYWMMLLLETNICRFERRLQNIFNTWLYIDESCNVDPSVQRVNTEDLCVPKRSLILLGKLVSHLIGAISKYDLFCVFDLQVQIFAGWSYKALNTHNSKHSMCLFHIDPPGARTVAMHVLHGLV